MVETDRQGKYWALLLVLLVAVIAVSGTLAWSRYRPAERIEITLRPPQPQQGTISIEGAVANPGIYPATGDDTISGLIQAAGGTTAGADRDRLRLHVPRAGDTETAQKVDINRADAWLLAALPGIGETRARAIVEYRRTHGLFRNIGELTRVEGIGGTTYQRLRDLITVAD